MRIIRRNDNEYGTLHKGFNLRWPPEKKYAADVIYICSTPSEVYQAATQALSDGYRITVRSGGHCYEGFVTNKMNDENLAIIDLGEMKGIECDQRKSINSPWGKASDKYSFKIFTGNQNWDAYVALYKKSGKTLPGGTCYSVGIGGHISGGGYGLLSRLYGLTVDWVTGVDILVPSPYGRGLEYRHVRADSKNEIDRLLFKACCGAGGGNFGIIISYYFDSLPDAPCKAYWLPIYYPWDKIKPRFTQFLQAYWKWFSDNDSMATDRRDGVGNGGLFAMLKLNHVDSSDKIILSIQYTGPNGSVGGIIDEPLNDFIMSMNDAAGFNAKIYNGFISPNIVPFYSGSQSESVSSVDESTALDWMTISQSINGSGANQRGKYKSEYQILQFTEHACDTLLKYLTAATPEGFFKNTLIQIDSYGGAININGIGNTAVAQRKSILKTQYQTYWDDAIDDDIHLKWIRDVYSEIHMGKPSLPAYEGCYINYPDIDIKYNANGDVDPEWLNIYYGWNLNLINNLLFLKKVIDPHNVFCHELSIPLLPLPPINPEWILGNHYNKYDKVSHQGSNWECLATHDALSPDWAPGIAFSLWLRI